MSSVLVPIADHGNAVSAVPFVVPMLLVVAAIGFLMIRDRLNRRATKDANQVAGRR